jgi:hypothetical protein
MLLKSCVLTRKQFGIPVKGYDTHTFLMRGPQAEHPVGVHGVNPLHRNRGQGPVGNYH